MLNTNGVIEKINSKGTSYCTDATKNIFAKECRKCYLMLPLNEFSKKKQGFEGTRSICKQCDAKYKEQYQKENPDQGILRRHNYRARQQQLPAKLTLSDIIEMRMEQNSICLLAGSDESMVVDHFIPLSIGHGGSTFENCYYLHEHFNNTKGNKNPFEWIKLQRGFVQRRFYSVLVPMLAARNEMTVKEFTEYVYWCFANPRTIEDLQEETAI
ncbi:TPA: HNH endonuclease [Bacillus thuringiensis]|nr:HNH endonuclease [Bacillus thuringiensis]